jgi:hypothetical protein
MANEDISALTVEQMALFTKLEGIFMPQATKQRDDSYGQAASSAFGNSVRFVHYTSAEAALKIINSKRMWMRNTMCMSDYSEVQHGFGILQKFFSDKAKTDQFIAALDVCVPGAAAEAIDFFNRWWSDIQSHTYITSISEHDKQEDFHGRLSMWRAFGGNAARVAFVFNIPWSSGGGQALNLMFSPVAYLTENETHAVIYKVIENIAENHDFLRSVDRQTIVGSVFNMLIAGVTCLKHEGFREEREWRAIYSPHRSPSELMESSTEVIAGIPQLVYKIPLDVKASPALADLELSRIFDRLIIGPSEFSRPMYEAFQEALKNAGVPPETEKQRIFISGIPIRSTNA